MIETDTNVEVVLDIDLDKEVTCTENEHGVPAQWISTHSCCGFTEFLCEGHKEIHEKVFDVFKDLKCGQCFNWGHEVYRKI